MKVVGFFGFGLGITALVLALFNYYELVPFAESISHLDNDPYYSLWINAVELTHTVAILAFVISALALIITVIYFFRERKSLYVYGLGFSIVAILFSLPFFP